MSPVMSDNRRPDPRFAMIALEMTAEANPSPAGKAAVPTLLVSGDGLACPRCGNGAFQPIRGPSVACLGCPLPAPTYPLPAGVVLNTNWYRCERCGRRSQVTMSMSDVNLYCSGCGGLTCHARQDPPPPVDTAPRRTLTADARRRLDEAVARATGATVTYGPSVLVDEANDILLPRDHPSLVELTRAMLSILRLEDFDEYAARKRAGTGRTWKGIVELLARHYLATTRPTVWVLGGSESVDSWLCREVVSIRNELGNDHPARVTAVPPSSPVREGGVVAQLIKREIRLPPGVMLLVDHTFYEGRKGWDRVSYMPD